MDRVLEYVSHHPWLATATAVVVALIAVYEMRARSESLVSVTPQELIRLMNQGVLLLDLRPPEQYQAGHLAGARQMSGEQILKAADTLKKHREKPVVVYDDTGSLGTAAVGFYLLAFNVSSWVPGLIGTAVRYVSIAGFSRLAEDRPEEVGAELVAFLAGA